MKDVKLRFLKNDLVRKILLEMPESPFKVRDVVAKFGTKPGNSHRDIGKLVNAGLLSERAPKLMEDQRGKFYEITARGRDVKRQCK